MQLAKLIAASGNEGKIKEIVKIFKGVEIIPMHDAGFEGDIEENGQSFRENAYIKAKAVCDKLGLPALADDSGLCVDYLGGAPGIFSARYCEGTDQDRNTLLLKNMADQDDRACRFVCAIACVLPHGGVLSVRGECEGQLLRESHGEGGFGYDPLFYVPEHGCTFGELPPETKNRISHRGRALRKLREELEKRL